MIEELTYVRTSERHTLDPEAFVLKTLCGYFINNEWRSPAPGDALCRICQRFGLVLEAVADLSREQAITPLGEET